jgi:formylglycine-generating enzyme required for sulfatase activity
MPYMGRRSPRVAILLAVGLSVLAAASCVSVDPGTFMPEQGYLYGVGEGPSPGAAEEAARADLVRNGLTLSRDQAGGRGAPVEVSAATARAFPLPKLRPWAEKKTDASTSAAYRMKVTDWNTLEKKREAAISAEIAPELLALRAVDGPALAVRVQKAGQILERLKREGLTDILPVSRSVESLCREQADGLLLAVKPGEGFIGKDTVFTLRASTRDGKSPGMLPVRVQWAAAGVEPVEALLTTDPQGGLLLDYPAGEEFHNRAVSLSVETSFAPAAPSSAALSQLDAATAATYRYHHFDDARSFFTDTVRVPGGPFTAGALAGDRRATKKEAPRAARTETFLIDRTPVTNAQYQVFLADTRSASLPEYWDNPDYNQGDQPVVGVTWEDANRYAAWLSERLGVTRRLPTEDEWEKAARAGQEVIYPWGDQGPADGPRANFSGNGRHRGLAPVGSFEAGRNAYGLLDMAGNAWQWTSTTAAATAAGASAGTGAATGAPAVIVKGGSWMDGPGDLRVSNRREVDPTQGYVDVGFRLVTEVSE